MGTLVGIIGSTMLMVISLTIYDDVNSSLKKQYSELYHYDSYVFFDGTDAAAENIEKTLNDRKIPYAKVMYKRKYMTAPNGRVVYSHWIVYGDKPSFQKMVTLRPYKDTDSEDKEGIRFISSYRNYYGEKDSRTIKIADSNSVSGNKEIKVDGFFEYYLTNYQIFVDEKTYEDSFDETMQENCYMIRVGKDGINALLEKLKNIQGYQSFSYYYEESKKYFESFNGVAKVMVGVYFLLAVVMSFMVLLNILIMFVNEKKKELVTLMINGFSQKKARKYLYYDTIFLTVIGIALGILFGIGMADRNVSAFESDITMFVHRIDIKSCVIAGGVMALLSFVMSVISLHRIKKYKLTDINS